MSTDSTTPTAIPILTGCDIPVGGGGRAWDCLSLTPVGSGLRGGNVSLVIVGGAFCPLTLSVSLDVVVVSLSVFLLVFELSESSEGRGELTFLSDPLGSLGFGVLSEGMFVGGEG